MITAEKYLKAFRVAATQLDKKQLATMEIEVAVGEVLDCVFFKLYKKAWASPAEEPLTAKTRIFFSVWAGDEDDAEQKILYNIHAFKLRHLPGHAIESRKFADKFRTGFDKFAHLWPNVSVKYGPLTLMEGWIKVDPENFVPDVVKLANNFLTITSLIDDTLLQFEVKKKASGKDA